MGCRGKFPASQLEMQDGRAAGAALGVPLSYRRRCTPPEPAWAGGCHIAAMAPTTALAAKKPVTAREIEAVVRAASASVTAALAAGDAPRAAMAAATLALAAQKSSGPGGDDALCCAAGPLVAALDAGGGPGDVPGVAKNAAAALAAAVQAGGEDVAAAALGVGAVKAASNLATRAASVEGEWTNAVALLGALAGSGDAGALAVVQVRMLW